MNAAVTPAPTGAAIYPPIRHDWQLAEVLELFDQPFSDLLYQAQTLHRSHFDPNRVQLSRLLNIKTGGCPEDCAYCPQSAHFNTSLSREPLLALEEVLQAAQAARQQGAQRFCMGAAWRSPRGKDFERVLEMVSEVKKLGLETCATLGMLEADQAEQLRDAGLDFYNHNIDTSEAFYSKIISTRQYQDRLDTLSHVRDAGMKVCCGGIIGLGESREDRAAMLLALANLPEHPHSVPINQLVKVPGTPLADTAELDPFEMVRCIAVARLLMPHSYVRLSAGRAEMDEALQALCFLAGANSIFYGEKLLTTPNPEAGDDRRLLQRLGMQPAA
jgi:biotin synthase